MTVTINTNKKIEVNFLYKFYSNKNVKTVIMFPH
jgi:hypothetical protein